MTNIRRSTYVNANNLCECQLINYYDGHWTYMRLTTSKMTIQLVLSCSINSVSQVLQAYIYDFAKGGGESETIQGLVRGEAAILSIAGGLTGKLWSI